MWSEAYSKHFRYLTQSAKLLLKIAWMNMSVHYSRDNLYKNWMEICLMTSEKLELKTLNKSYNAIEGIFKKKKDSKLNRNKRRLLKIWWDKGRE